MRLLGHETVSTRTEQNFTKRGKKRLWSILRCCLGICLPVLRKNLVPSYTHISHFLRVYSAYIYCIFVYFKAYIETISYGFLTLGFIRSYLYSTLFTALQQNTHIILDGIYVFPLYTAVPRKPGSPGDVDNFGHLQPRISQRNYYYTASSLSFTVRKYNIQVLTSFIQHSVVTFCTSPIPVGFPSVLRILG